MKAGQVIDYHGLNVGVPYWAVRRDGSFNEDGLHADFVEVVKELKVSNVTRAFLERALRKKASKVEQNAGWQIGERSVDGTRYDFNGGRYKHGGVSVFVRKPNFTDLTTDVLVEAMYRIDGKDHPFNPVREVVENSKVVENRIRALRAIESLERTVLSSPMLGLSKTSRTVDYPLSNAVYMGSQ